MTRINIHIALAAVFSFFAAVPESVYAENWELRTVDEPVPGTREIERGKYAKAIEISMVQLPHVSPIQKVAVLTNLCIANIATRNFEKAEEFCNQAVEQPNENAVSFNNRGVLQALQGDLESAMDDFATASTADCIGACSQAASAPKDLPRPIARRNLGKAEYLAQKASSDADKSVAARIN